MEATKRLLFIKRMVGPPHRKVFARKGALVSPRKRRCCDLQV